MSNPGLTFDGSELKTHLEEGKIPFWVQLHWNFVSPRKQEEFLNFFKKIRDHIKAQM